MQHKPSTIIVIGLIVSVIAVGYLWSWPSRVSWISAKARLTEVKEEIDDLTEKQQLITQLLNNELELNEYTQLSLQLVPETEERTEFATLLNSIATANSVSISGITYIEPKKAAEKQKRTTTQSNNIPNKTEPEKQGLVFETTVTGEYLNTINFLQAIEHAPRYVGLTSITVSATSGENALQTVRIQGSIYFQPEKPAIKKDLTYNRLQWDYLTARRAISPLTNSANPFDSIINVPSPVPPSPVSPAPIPPAPIPNP